MRGVRELDEELVALGKKLLLVQLRRRDDQHLQHRAALAHIAHALALALALHVVEEPAEHSGESSISC